MSRKYDNLNNIPDPISKLYLTLSENDKNLAYKFSNFISDFDANLTIKTNNIDRVNKLTVGRSITLYTNDDDINSARVYSYQDAKEVVVTKFQNLLNDFILDCRNNLGNDYDSYINEIEEVFNRITKDDILRSGENLSILETNVKNIIVSVKKIKNDRKNYGAIQTNNGCSKELVITNNKVEKGDGNFPGAAVTGSVCGLFAVCAIVVHLGVSVGGRCTNTIGKCIQKKILGP